MRRTHRRLRAERLSRTLPMYRQSLWRALAQRQAWIGLCLWALLAAQGLALWHAQVHGLPQVVVAVADASTFDEHVHGHDHDPGHGHDRDPAQAFGHAAGAECALLDNLLGLADGSVPLPWWVPPPVLPRALLPGCAQCTPGPLAAFAARAPPQA
jgi:hypothetical protein